VGILVSDTSVLIDLERGDLLETALRSRLELVVPDVLYRQEIEPYSGDRWTVWGLAVIELSPMEAEHGQDYLSRDPALSVPDAFALALARDRAWTLVTGDRRLRQMAQAEVVPVHGLLWLVEQLASDGVDSAFLSAGLTRVLDHPLCRLPRPDAGRLLARLRAR
jgi:predicted nucleic acid-binding protein